MQTYPPSTRIGQYEIASLPMMGGMGVVYFALDHGNDGRPVALKTFRPELLPNRAARDRFLREGTAWIELGSHPHIVRCYKVEYIDPTAFLVLELIAKEQNMPDASLRSWLIPGHPLPLEQALLFALQIARGMQHATEKVPGFVHRDLKPENILVGADKLPGTNINRLRVTDFGLVKTIVDSRLPAGKRNDEEIEPNQVQFTRGVGTPLYMAPEQWKGEPVGVFTDVYAFGCILYEMLAGQPIVEGRTIAVLENAHCNGMLRLMPSKLSSDITMLLGKCTARNPNSRFDTWIVITEILAHICSTPSGVNAPQIPTVLDAQSIEQVQLIRSYNVIGQAYSHIGKVELAKGYFEKAFVIAREIGDKGEYGPVLNNLGTALSELGEARPAVEYFEEALALAHEFGDRNAEGSILRNLGTCYLKLGEVRRAADCYTQSLTINREIGSRSGEGDALDSLGMVSVALGQSSKAIKYYEQSLNLRNEIHDRRGEEATLVNLGVVYAISGQLLQAISCYERALHIAHEIGDSYAEGSCLANLGIAYKEIGNISDAIKYYELALNIARQIGNQRGEGEILGNLGVAYQLRGDTQRAIEYFQEGLAIDQKIGNRVGESITLSNLGNLYKDFGDSLRAISYYQRSLALHNEINDANAKALTLFNLTVVYAQQGDYENALPLAQEAASIWGQIGSPNAGDAQKLERLLQSKSRATQVGSIQNAFVAFQNAASLQDLYDTVKLYPFMKGKQFIQALEEIINEQFQSQNKPALEQRLAWLRQIATQK